MNIYRLRNGEESSNLLKNIREILSDFYSIRNKYKLKRLGKCDVFLIEVGDKSFVFKIHSSLSLPNVEELSMIYKCCSENGLCPRIFPTKAGAFLGWSGECIFSLQEHIYHEVISYDDLELLAKRLAELHTVLKSLEISGMNNHLTRVVTNIRSASVKYGYQHLIPTIKMIDRILMGTPKQMIHGDLHTENIVVQNGDLLFLDFDSSICFAPVSDVAFAAYRFFRGDVQKMERFVEVYNHYNTKLDIDWEHIWPFVVYNILQRILFILIERNKGHTQWMIDLENQRRYLDEATEHL